MIAVTACQEYDEHGRIVHYINKFGYEEWFDYDINGNIKQLESLKIKMGILYKLSPK